jgi:serine/threonine protein kinase
LPLPRSCYRACTSDDLSEALLVLELASRGDLHAFLRLPHSPPARAFQAAALRRLGLQPARLAPCAARQLVAQSLLLDLALALRHLHSQPAAVCHGDIKPGNVLLCASGRAKLADFGMAHVLPGGGQQRRQRRQRQQRQQRPPALQLHGTVDYAAPEALAARSPAGVGPAADVFSFAVLAWQVLSWAAGGGFRAPFSHLLQLEELPPLARSIRLLRLPAEKRVQPMEACWPLWQRQMLRACWQQQPELRPSAGQLVALLRKQLAASVAACAGALTGAPRSRL